MVKPSYWDNKGNVKSRDFSIIVDYRPNVSLSCSFYDGSRIWVNNHARDLGVAVV